MFAQDSTMNSSSDDEGVMSHFVLSKPRKTPYSALNHPKEKDGRPSETLFCFGASVCAVIIALLTTVGYAVFVHMRLLHLENVLQKLQTGLEWNSSDPALNKLKMTAAQMERVKMLNDMTDLSQFQDNLSSVHDQFVTLQRFYKDMEENPNIVQFLSSITEQLTPLSQSVVLMSDGFHDIQKSVEIIETDHHTLLQSVDELNAMAHNLQSSITALRNETYSIESRLSIVELLQRGDGREPNLSSIYAQLKNGPSLESDFRMKDLRAQIANTSHLIQHLEDRVLSLQVDFTQLKNAALDETTTHQLENRIAELEEKLSLILANRGNFLNITIRRSSDVKDGDIVLREVGEGFPSSATDYGP